MNCGSRGIEKQNKKLEQVWELCAENWKTQGTDNLDTR